MIYADEMQALDAYRAEHATCDIQRHPWTAIFEAGWHARERTLNVGDLEDEVQRLRCALGEIARTTRHGIRAGDVERILRQIEIKARAALAEEGP